MKKLLTVLSLTTSTTAFALEKGDKAWLCIDIDTFEGTYIDLPAKGKAQIDREGDENDSWAFYELDDDGDHRFDFSDDEAFILSTLERKRDSNSVFARHYKFSGETDEDGLYNGAANLCAPLHKVR